jgi:hypothetical protein
MQFLKLIVAVSLCSPCTIFAQEKPEKHPERGPKIVHLSDADIIFQLLRDELKESDATGPLTIPGAKIMREQVIGDYLLPSNRTDLVYLLRNVGANSDVMELSREQAAAIQSIYKDSRKTTKSIMSGYSTNKDEARAELVEHLHKMDSQILNELLPEQRESLREMIIYWNGLPAFLFLSSRHPELGMGVDSELLQQVVENELDVIELGRNQIKQRIFDSMMSLLSDTDRAELVSSYQKREIDLEQSLLAIPIDVTKDQLELVGSRGISEIKSLREFVTEKNKQQGKMSPSIDTYSIIKNGLENHPEYTAAFSDQSILNSTDLAGDYIIPLQRSDFLPLIEENTIRLKLTSHQIKRIGELQTGFTVQTVEILNDDMKNKKEIRASFVELILTTESKILAELSKLQRNTLREIVIERNGLPALLFAVSRHKEFGMAVEPESLARVAESEPKFIGQQQKQIKQHVHQELIGLFSKDAQKILTDNFVVVDLEKTTSQLRIGEVESQLKLIQDQGLGQIESFQQFFRESGEKAKDRRGGSYDRQVWGAKYGGHPTFETLRLKSPR